MCNGFTLVVVIELAWYNAYDIYIFSISLPSFGLFDPCLVCNKVSHVILALFQKGKA
jgi:hypothetical protein